MLPKCINILNHNTIVLYQFFNYLTIAYASEMLIFRMDKHPASVMQILSKLSLNPFTDRVQRTIDIPKCSLSSPSTASGPIPLSSLKRTMQQSQEFHKKDAMQQSQEIRLKDGTSHSFSLRRACPSLVQSRDILSRSVPSTDHVTAHHRRGHSELRRRATSALMKSSPIQRQFATIGADPASPPASVSTTPFTPR